MEQHRGIIESKGNSFSNIVKNDDAWRKITAEFDRRFDFLFCLQV